MTDLVRTVELSYLASDAAPIGVRLRLAVKRTLDVALAAVGLVVTAPVILLIGLLIRFGSPGPALFRQRRIGAGGRPFDIVKFRTMIDGAEAVLEADPELRERYQANNFKLPSEGDPRVTRLGRFLRSTSLDELPQLWNVLIGDMSLVGPRPVPGDHFFSFAPRSQESYTRVRPGITGSWQIKGRSDAGDAMAEYNDRYVHEWSNWNDLCILVKTVPAVIRRRGAY